MSASGKTVFVVYAGDNVHGKSVRGVFTRHSLAIASLEAVFEDLVKSYGGEVVGSIGENVRMDSTRRVFRLGTSYTARLLEFKLDEH